MKAKITVVDDQGNTFEHEFELAAVSAVRTNNRKDRPKQVERPLKPHVSEVSRVTRHIIDLSLPVRPFMKKHRAQLSGPQKFALLIARMTNGDLKKELSAAEVEKQWNKMKAIMGVPFNPSRASRARDSGWVDSPRYGYYKLLPNWESLVEHA